MAEQCMSATDELRRMLDERGVEHYDRDGHTLWEPINDGWYRYHATESADGTVNLHMHVLTPAQAVEATLGRDTDATRERQGVAETCHVECFDDGVDEALDGEWISYAPPTWYLSCSHTVEGSERPHFCPSCGRRVVSE